METPETFLGLPNPYRVPHAFSGGLRAGFWGTLAYTNVFGGEFGGTCCNVGL